MNFPFLVIGEMTPILFDNICLFVDVGSWFMIATFLMWFFNLLGLEDKHSMEGQIPEPNDTQGRNFRKTMIGEVGDLFFWLVQLLDFHRFVGENVVHSSTYPYWEDHIIEIYMTILGSCLKKPLSPWC